MGINKKPSIKKCDCSLLIGYYQRMEEEIELFSWPRKADALLKTAEGSRGA